ncbi:ribonuclease H [Sesbania bispinosa]|nr:ribonuclease H [Sesbania bispinosa]
MSNSSGSPIPLFLWKKVVELSMPTETATFHMEINAQIFAFAWSQSPLGNKFLALPQTHIGLKQKVFEQRDINLQMVFNRALNASIARIGNHSPSNVPARNLPTQVDPWIPPPLGWYKVNVDATYATGEV